MDVASLAGGLGVVHGGVGVAEGVGGAGVGEVAGGNADAGRAVDVATGQGIGGDQEAEKGIGESGGVGGARQTVEEDDELVASHAGGQCGAEGRCGQIQCGRDADGDILEELIAGVVTEGVVDDLKAVEI